MSLRIDATDGGYRLAGELDMATCDDLLQVLKDHPDPITLDFSHVSFMDSSGLRTLLEGAKARRDGDVLVIVDPTPQVQRVLDISLPDGAPGLEVRSGADGAS
jgi:anti-anti-sigma factor